MSNPSIAAPNRAIQLAAPVKVYSLGGPIPIRVRYVNQSSGPIVFDEPVKTWEVQIGIFQGEQGMDLPFGKILRTAAEGRVRWIVEEAETIKLAPGAKYDFAYDAGARWPERFFVGKQTIQIKDLHDTPPVLSNVIELEVDYTAETFPKLLRLLHAADTPEETRAWAAGWVKRVYTDFDGNVERAAAWWGQNRESAAVRKTMDAINHRPGTR